VKKQIKRLSPHQNGKVFAILFALGSLPFLIIMLLGMFMSMPDMDQHGNPIGAPYFMFVVFPVLYLIFGYISVVVGSAIYNFMFKYISGFEFETNDENA
jgi:hypothetical protein